MAKATIIHKTKFYVSHEVLDTVVVVELKVWEVLTSVKYPDGIKYSLFCIDVGTGELIIGFDNHYPKGHHIHTELGETKYFFRGIEGLLDDFYLEMSKKGYRI